MFIFLPYCNFAIRRLQSTIIPQTRLYNRRGIRKAIRVGSYKNHKHMKNLRDLTIPIAKPLDEASLLMVLGGGGEILPAKTTSDCQIIAEYKQKCNKCDKCDKCVCF